MKVSSLFNPDKIKEERKKFKEYQELMGIGFTNNREHTRRNNGRSYKIDNKSNDAS